MAKKIFLFEVSWEVCNKVGGINTVLRSKCKQAIQYAGKNYILIGPLLENNSEFIETTSLDQQWQAISKALQEKNLRYKLGYWNVLGKPKVILVDFKNRYDAGLLLNDLWREYKLDSLNAEYEFVEPVLFSTASGEIVEAIAKNCISSDTDIVAQFHEWMCAAGILHLKKHAKNVATIFTTHATVLGRCLSGNYRSIYNLPNTFDADEIAGSYGVKAKHTIEYLGAKHADCFTTVSNITAEEAKVILGNYPDKIVHNGLNANDAPDYIKCAEVNAEKRKAILDIAHEVTGKDFVNETKLWITSGRYEFHNKGFDVLIDALDKLDKQLPKDHSPILMLFLIAADSNPKPAKDTKGIISHKVHNPDNDMILKYCEKLNFNSHNRKITILFSPAYLDGNDGIFNLRYEEIISLCDLSIFPSFYEPWGYTPHESIVYAVPTITTDLSGFGSWAKRLKNIGNSIHVLERRNKKDNEFSDELASCLKAMLLLTEKEISAAKNRSRDIAELTDWSCFFKDYLSAYKYAISINSKGKSRYNPLNVKHSLRTPLCDFSIRTPSFHRFRHVCSIPKCLEELRGLVYNFWWSWNPEAESLLRSINPDLWNSVNENPVKFLHSLSYETLNSKARNPGFMRCFNEVIKSFKDYCNEAYGSLYICDNKLINSNSPIAYFCLEYAIHSSLPIYSGGLGILAGDYLKTFSDLKLPMVAVGLLYREGYFKQSIDHQGNQVPKYIHSIPSCMPLSPVKDDSDNQVIIELEMPGHTLYVTAWEAKVGRISLYLLDTDLPQNNDQDRELTHRLYGGGKETRIKQEIVLGIAGIRLLVDKLNINPAVYHLNEGHSAFLLLERIKNFIKQGFSYNEAYNSVRASSIFTTHTPVPAGNETFSEDLVRQYFSGDYTKQCGLTLVQLLSLGEEVNNDNLLVFSMTILALRLTEHANSVSKIHEGVAKKMWTKVWPGFLETETPICNVTNGVHLYTWLGDAIKSLYDRYLGYGWGYSQNSSKLWDKLNKISDTNLWESHQTQKTRLLDIVREHVVKEYRSRGESRTLINNSLDALRSDTLVIGLARRFATYKRHHLILHDIPHLSKLLNDKSRPVVLLIAGKAHPADGAGKDIIKQVISTIRNKELNGHVIFLEGYDMDLGAAMTQGVDIWLNNPIMSHEACGTSGIKAAFNGVLNCSVCDGWWAEAYVPKIGWEIPSFDHAQNDANRFDMENSVLLELLEQSIIPLYYKKNRHNFNPNWVQKMRETMKVVSRQFNTERMVEDYFVKLYNPATKRTQNLLKNNAALLHDLVNWKNVINSRFETMEIIAAEIKGIQNCKINNNGTIEIELSIKLGDLHKDEIIVEFILAKISDNSEELQKIEISKLEFIKQPDDVANYRLKKNIKNGGFYAYGVRIMPYHSALLRKQDAEPVIWG